MATSAPVLSSAPVDLSEPDPFAGFADPDAALGASSSSTCAEPPLTSEPPLASAAPLTSEPAAAAELPLTSEPTLSAGYSAEGGDEYGDLTHY